MCVWGVCRGCCVWNECRCETKSQAAAETAMWSNCFWWVACFSALRRAGGERESPAFSQPPTHWGGGACARRQNMCFTAARVQVLLTGVDIARCVSLSASFFFLFFARVSPRPVTLSCNHFKRKHTRAFRPWAAREALNLQVASFISTEGK